MKWINPLKKSRKIQCLKINKTHQDLKLKIESIKKKTEGIQEMKNLGIWKGTTETRFTNRIQEIEKRIWGIEDMIENRIDAWVKENVNPEKLLI